MATTAASSWSAILPIKMRTSAKTRLGLPQDARARLAEAFLRDVVNSCLNSASVDQVLVVSDEELVIPNARVLAVPGLGLNDALRYGAKQASGPVAALLADLPALRSQDLQRVLATAGECHRAFVCDAEGIGTTLLTSLESAELGPTFGAQSRARHRDSGATELADPELTRLRRDVDTYVDLLDAIRLGVGRETRAALQELPGP